MKKILLFLLLSLFSLSLAAQDVIKDEAYYAQKSLQLERYQHFAAKRFMAENEYNAPWCYYDVYIHFGLLEVRHTDKWETITDKRTPRNEWLEFGITDLGAKYLVPPAEWDDAEKYTMNERYPPYQYLNYEEPYASMPTNKARMEDNRKQDYYTGGETKFIGIFDTKAVWRDFVEGAAAKP